MQPGRSEPARDQAPYRIGDAPTGPPARAEEDLLCLIDVPGQVAGGFLVSVHPKAAEGRRDSDQLRPGLMEPSPEVEVRRETQRVVEPGAYPVPE
jgi:hypothetical protein